MRTRPSVLDGVDVTAKRWRVAVVASTGSTNADLAAEARAGAASWSALVAGEQTAGRGRLTRTWSSPPGTSVSLSVLLRPSRPVAEWGLLPLLTGLGVARAVESLGAAAVLKWPNDVLLSADGERKVCGILAEFVASPSPAVVVGMGLNVSQARDEFPVDTATSLALVGVSATRAEVVRAVLEQLARVYGEWDANGWGAVRGAYEAGCVTLGRHVRVELPDGTSVAGVATAVLDDGRIVVGSRTFAAGDIHHLRPL
jgi:BirA family biotin operon repressor/biotin-[acetyl-CoA-carboxylase] ligase